MRELSASNHVVSRTATAQGQASYPFVPIAKMAMAVHLKKPAVALVLAAFLCLAFSVSADTMTRVTGPGGSAAAPASALDVGSHAVRALDVGRMAVTAAVSKGAVLVDLEVAAVAVAALEATAVSAMELAVASVVELAAASVEVVDISRFSRLVSMFFDLA
jgi:hypothetical protein